VRAAGLEATEPGQVGRLALDGLGLVGNNPVTGKPALGAIIAPTARVKRIPPE
jgi:hypothetical protein